MSDTNHHCEELCIPWSSLDDSLWERIFRYLPLRTLVQMEAVCRRWCKAIRSKRHWSTLHVGTDIELSAMCGPGDMSALVSHSALGAPRKPLVNGLNFWARFSPIKEIDLNGTSLVTGSLMKYLEVLRHCKKLETLKMSNLRFASGRRQNVFFLSKHFKKVEEFVQRAEKLRCFELDARVQSTSSSSSRQRWLDPWQWHIIIQWLRPSHSVIRVMHLQIMNLPISAFAKLPNNIETFFEDYVHPFVNLQSLGDAITESALCSLTMGRFCLLGDEGALLLLECIRRNRSLRNLQIRHSQISSSGARQLAASIKRGCPPLDTLDLRSNAMSPVAAVALRTALQSIRPQAQLLT